jgi:outer membrane protein assembly factor BamD (BamD/ComL family)
MRYLKLFTISLFIAFISSSCNNSEQKATDNNIINDDIADSISYYERVLFANANPQKINRKDALKLSDFYISWAKKNHNDSLAPEYYLKSADILMNMKKPVAAIKSLNMVIDHYQESSNAPYALFLKAFVYEDMLNDNVNAERYYKKFINQYPENEYVDDAKISLKNLGKTPEELIKEFENK